MATDGGGGTQAAPTAAAEGPYFVQVRFMMQMAMVLFIYTVVIGILNGVDLVDFDRKVLVAHLHVGTLAWLTMAVFAASLSLFGRNDPDNRMAKRMAVAAPVVAAAYNVAFLTTTNILRPILGTVMLLVILWFAWWGFKQVRGVTLSVVHLGLLAGLATSVIGAVFGILLGLMISNPDLEISSRFGDAHPATMVIGFLIPVGMAFAEWTLRPESVLVKATRAGWVQIGAPSLGAVAVTLGILLDAEPLLMLSLPLELIGLGVFLWRMFPGIRQASWLSTDQARHGTVAVIFLIVNIAIFVYLIAEYVEDFDAAPRRLLLALDHSIFVGVLTMTIIPFIARLSTATRPAWVDHVVFWGIGLGIGGFVAGLLLDTDPFLHAFTPILGVAILLAIAVHVRGMGNPSEALREA